MTPRRRFYAAAALLLFAVEILIALLMHDTVIRPYAGDGIAVILVYALLRSATRLGVLAAVAAATIFACAIEFGQYFHFVDRVGLGDSRIARIVLGTQFERADFLAYAIGALLVLAGEWAWKQRLPAVR